MQQDDHQVHKTQRKFQERTFLPDRLIQQKPTVRILTEQIIHKGVHYHFKRVTCIVGDQKVYKYEAAFRTTRKENVHIDGVDVVPIIQYKDKDPEIVVIANWRPPANKFCIQFPAGMVEDQNFEEEARRETLEETGYRVKRFVPIPYPLIYSDPWRTNDCIHLYLATVDGDDPNTEIKQNLEEDQNIRVYKFPLNSNLFKNLSQLAQSNNYGIEKKVWTVAIGLLTKRFMK